MKKRVDGLVRQLNEARKRRLRFEALMTAVSVLVTGSVFWQLRRFGSAISDETSPTAELAEDSVPVVETDADPPGLASEADSITDAAKTAAAEGESGIAEDPEDWEATLPVFTDERPQQRIAAIAASQLGVTEGSGAVLLSDDGSSRTGYSRYGAWYGNPYGEWNTMFTYFCMYYAGIEQADVPYGSGVWSWYEKLAEKEMLSPCGSETEGDILFFDTDSDGDPDRTGIVSGTEETEDGVMLRVIEGNCEGAVAEKQYLRGSESIAAVLSADAFVPASSETESEPETVTVGFIGDTESGIRVEASALHGVFPEGTVMLASDVANETAMQAAADTLGEDAEIREAVAVDISFRTAEGEELEPAEGQSVSVRIVLPEEKQLSGDSCSLLHIGDNGEGTVVENAAVAADGAEFEAESFSVYVMASTGETAGDYYNGETIYMKLGESVTFRMDTTEERPYFKLYDSWDSSQNKAYLTPNIYSDDQVRTWGEGQNYNGYWNAEHTSYHHEVTFTANCVTPAGSTLRVHTPEGTDIPVVITNQPDSPIMIKSSHGYKDSDHIREWLGPYDGTTYGLSFPWGFGMVNRDGYVPNSKERPFIITVGETMDFYCDTNSAADAFTFTYEGENGTPTGALASVEQSTGSAHHSVQLTGTAPGMVHVYMPATGEDMWIKVLDRSGTSPFSQILNHADMEIADGGTYTVSSTRIENGVTYVDIKLYQADVDFVHDAYIYDPEGNPIQHYTSELDPQYPLYRIKMKEDPATGKLVPDLDEDGNTQPDYDFPIGDYEQFGEKGGKQYEMTSAWVANISSKANRKTYDALDSATAEFDVNLYLTPKQKYTYRVDPNGNLIPVSENLNWSADPETREHIIFKLDHQDVIDARNKCPVNNGLDFTARAEFTALELPVQKKLLNGTLADGAFTFDVIDLNDEKLSTTHEENNKAVAESVSCDENGNGLFRNMRFFKEGTYYFRIDERTPEPEDQQGISYDDTAYYFKVIVSKDNANGFLTAVPVFLKDNGSGDPAAFPADTEHEDTVFTNYAGYQLPETGGTGTVPYLACGILLISAAFIMPLMRRRKEADSDS